ncbi:MAG: 3-methyl-2-oxobutanoate dehydrogenase subunit VorB [Candidatus Omnitrophica bacterium]|nr:3-methyl-2-oxobutanoate dehydrogenase subunit VorB [Candidatus Omnitrophota bacterium]
MNKKILMTGNEAFAKGALDAGCRFYAGYPITPQNELPAYMALNMPQVGGVFIQAESEIAAINMVFGASAAGARSMTSSSSPGISLKQEGISYLAGAELPSVIINVMRAGPGLGNIWPSQSDYFQATRSAGHGDSHCIVLAPSAVQESYDIMTLAFDLADKYRNPVMIMGDGLLGQMMEPVLATNQRQATGDRRQATKPWAVTGCKGRKRNITKSFYLREGDLEQFNILLQKKYQEIQEKEERYEGLFLEDAELVLVGYGTMSRIAKSAMYRLREENYKIGLIRPITLWPFPKKVFESMGKAIFLAVEMSYGQMVEDVKLALNCRFPVEFLGRSGGGVVSEEDIINKVKGLINKTNRDE